MKWRRSDGVEWLESDLAGASACFTTRLGGVSQAPFDSLNLGILTDDDGEAVRQNRWRLADALGIDPVLVLMGRQVHGHRFAFHSAPPDHSCFADPGPPPEDADGQLTDARDLYPLVLVADCLPVALAGETGVAMLHCGWRGLAGDLIARASERIGATHAAIGPGIGPCCFEVGDEVRQAFAGFGDEVRSGRNLDLWRSAEIALRRAGVHSVETAQLCTYCDAGRFFSHRRDKGVTGRQGAIMIPKDSCKAATATPVG